MLQVASRRLAASRLPFVEIMLILAERGRERENEKTAHVGTITKIVDCIRIVFGLPYNYKPNLSLKMIQKPFEPSRNVYCVTVFAIQIGSHVAEPDTFT